MPLKLSSDMSAEETRNRDKAREKAKTKSWNNAENWANFIKSIIFYLIATILLGVYGAGFIFLTSRSGEEMAQMLPTDPAFYAPRVCEHEVPNSFNTVNCTKVSNGFSTETIDNFPYDYINPNVHNIEPKSRVNIVLNWFAQMCKSSFLRNRMLLKSWLSIFTPNTPLGNQTFQIFVAAPFTAVFSWVSFFTGSFFPLGAAFTTCFKFSLFGMFLGWTWGIAMLIGGVVFMRFVATLALFPMSQNWKEVSEIFTCNVKSLVILFGFFVCGSAFDTLDPDIASVMALVYLLLVGYTVYKMFASRFL
jgi:hypothetical protein